MTSPLQLKYLEAMGIPVWVSRELVVVEEKTDTGHSVEAGQETTLSVENILHDLEAIIDKPSSPENVVEAQPSDHVSVSTNSNVQKSPVTTNISHTLTDMPNVLGQTSGHTVYASGNLQADWMVIGESPEFINHDSNQPYTADAGVLLVNMLRAVGIDNPRTQSYLVNILKNSENTETDQASELNALLLDSIHKVQPKMVLIVGQLAAQNLLQSKEPLARLRGKAHTLPDTNIPVVVTYYPSYLLSKPMDKRKAWNDLKLAMSLLT